VAASSRGHGVESRFEALTNGASPSSILEVPGPYGAAMHIIHSRPGRLTVTYRAQIRTGPEGGSEGPLPAGPPSAYSDGPAEYERQVYLRPSRYCPSDHLVGFAVAEFGAGPHVGGRISDITEWIRMRTGYVPGASTVHDSAEDTLLTGVGTCRDFAHLGIALCRATGVPARFASVYAPGLFPMDFHAVFEAFEDGHWRVHDPTGLAPRSAMVRIATGRDAADAAFAAVTSGIADLERVEVSAIAQPTLPVDDQHSVVHLA